MAAHPIEGGGRFVDCGIEARGGLPDGARAGAGLPGGPGGGHARPRRGRRPAVPARAGRHRSSRGRLPGQPVCRLADSARGSSSRWARGRCGPPAGHEPIFDKIGHREDASRPWWASWKAGSRRRPPSWPRSPELPRPALGRDAPGRADGQPGGRRPGRRPLGRDGPAQARRSWTSTCPGSWPAHGTAPLPPVAADDLAAIGRTNDAILYGARVILFVTGDDDSLKEIGPQVPSTVLARPRRALRGDLRPLQPRLLCRRSPPVQPGRGRLPERRDRLRPRLRPDGPRRPGPVVLLLSRGHVGATGSSFPPVPPC